MKELLKKKRVVDVGMVEVSHHCSAIMKSNVALKREDLGAFTIPYIIGVYLFNKSLCDLGEIINLIPLVIFKKLGLGAPKPTPMRLLMADRSIKRPVGILFDVLVRVDKFILLADFVVLDCDVDLEVPIILGSPFLATH